MLNLKDFEKLGIEFDPKSKSGYTRLKSKHSGIMDLHIEYRQNQNKTSDLIVKMWHETIVNHKMGLKDPLVIMGVNYHATKNEEVYYLEYHDENMNYHTTDEAEMIDFVENIWFPNLINNEYHFDHWHEDLFNFHYSFLMNEMINVRSKNSVYIEIGKWTYYFDNSIEDEPLAEKWLTSGKGNVIVIDLEKSN